MFGNVQYIPYICTYKRYIFNKLKDIKMKLENVIDFEAVTTETNNIINNLSVETKNFFTRVYHYRNDTSGKLATSLNFLLDYSQESLTGFQKDLETIYKKLDVIIATFNKLLESNYKINLNFPKINPVFNKTLQLCWAKN